MLAGGWVVMIGDLPFSPHLTIESAQYEIILTGRKTQIINSLPTRIVFMLHNRDKNTNICIIGWSQRFV